MPRLSPCPPHSLSKMSNGGASLPAGNSSLASTHLVVNPDPAGPPPVTSPAVTSSNGTGRADQSMDGMSESVTSSDQPNGSSPMAPTPASSPASSLGRHLVPTLATPMAQDNTPPDDPPPPPASPTSQDNTPPDDVQSEPAPNGSTGDQEEEEEESK